VQAELSAIFHSDTRTLLLLTASGVVTRHSAAGLRRPPRRRLPPCNGGSEMYINPSTAIF